MDRIAGTGNANLSLYWEDASASGITNCADLTIARWNGTSWDERAGTATGGSSCTGAGTGLVTSNAVITAFSPFTLASKSTGVNPLPVELIDFSAKCLGDQIDFNWTTASEKNNAYFLLESSEDGVDWQMLTLIDGSGNSKLKISYTYHHKVAADQQLYYRLSQVDLNGKKETFTTVYPNCSSTESIMTLYPNPSNGQVTLRVNYSNDAQLKTFKFIDGLGKICLQKEINFTKGWNEFTFDLDLNSGVYSVLLYDHNVIIGSQKLILSK